MIWELHVIMHVNVQITSSCLFSPAL
jgi:hypothetical protein